MSNRHKTNRRRRRILKLASYQNDLCFHCQGAMVFLEPDRVYPHAEGNHPDVASVDHAHPTSQGGTNRLDNMIIAHRRCNSARRSTPLTSEERERLAALNERRRELIAEDAGAQNAVTFGVASPAANTLVQILNALDGSHGARLRTRVNRQINVFNKDLAELRHIPALESRHRFASLLLADQQRKAEGLPHEVRKFVLNVIKSVYMKRRPVLHPERAAFGWG